MPSDCVHRNAETQHMRAHDEDENQDLPDSQNLPSNRSGYHHTDISEILHRWMGELEFADDPARVCGDQAEEEDEEQTGHEAENGEGLREREYAERDVFGDHEDGCVPPIRKVSIMRFTVRKGYVDYHLQVL